jgi:hypothetical protein
VNLTLGQMELVSNVRRADADWRDAKVRGKTRARQLVEAEIAQLGDERDRRVRQAFEAGIPKSRILTEGLGTSAPISLLSSLARTEAGA